MSLLAQLTLLTSQCQRGKYNDILKASDLFFLMDHRFEYGEFEGGGLALSRPKEGKRYLLVKG